MRVFRDQNLGSAGLLWASTVPPLQYAHSQMNVSVFKMYMSVRVDHACFVYGGSMFVHGGEVLVRSTPGADAERVSLVKGSVTTTVPSQAGFARMCVDDMYRLDCGACGCARPL